MSLPAMQQLPPSLCATPSRPPHLRGKDGGHAAEQSVPGAVLGIVPVVCR